MTQLVSLTNDKLVKLDLDSSSETEGLQVWLASHPELLGGEEMDPNDPRRFLLVQREIHDSSGFLDHLFVDQEAVPTFVEAKLSTNPEARRKVVGQLLDYASEAAASWTGDKLKSWFADRCAGAGLGADEVLSEFEPSPPDADEFWHRAEENLRAGNVRLMFICDEVPPSLQRIVEFLNERMDPTEVLALQLQCLRAEGHRIYSSTLVGATERARAKKGKARKPPVLPALIDKGLLGNGQELWLLRESLPASARPENDNDPRLRMTLDLEGGTPMIAYQPPDQEVQSLWPSEVYGTVRKLIDAGYTSGRLNPVHDRFAVEPGGKSLGQMAIEAGAWSTEQTV